MVENLTLETKTYSLEIGAPLNQIIEIQPSAQLTLEMAMNGVQGVAGTNGTDGVDGAQIASVVRTTGSGIAGETDTYTITMTDTSTFTFEVTNGVPAATMLTNTDLNTVVISGTYGVIGALNTNIPVSGESYMEVLSDGTRVMQVLIYSSGDQFSRVLDGTWSAWLQHNTIANIDGLEDALNSKANQATTYTKDEVDAALSSTSTSPILKPTITAPTSGTIDFSGAVTSTYATSDSFAGVQDYVLWEAGNIDFSVIYATYEGASNLTSWTPSVGLPLTTVYVRTKQGSDNHRSEYSDVINYVTPNVTINTPTLTVTGTPTDVPETPTLTTSAFAVTGGSDTHASTSWYVKLAGTTVWSSVADAVNLLSITVPAGILLENTAYTFEAFHTGTTYGDSATVTVSGTTLVSFLGYEKYLAVGHSLTPFITTYGQDIDTFTKLANPATLPTSTGLGIAFSADGTYMAVAHLTTPSITIYKRAGDVFTKLADPTTLPKGGGFGVAFSSDGTYMAVATIGVLYDGGSYHGINIYKRDGDVFTALSIDNGIDSEFMALSGYSASFSPDGNYLAFGISHSPFIVVYKRAGDVFTKLSDPATLPSGPAYGVSFNHDSTSLSVAHGTTPFVTIYNRSGDVFTKLANPATLPTSTASDIAFSPDGVYLGVSHGTTPFITIYKRAGDVFTKLTNPATLPTGHGEGVAFSKDGVYMGVSHYTTPFVSVYKRSGDVFTKLANPATLPPSTGFGIAFYPRAFEGVL